MFTTNWGFLPVMIKSIEHVSLSPIQVNVMGKLQRMQEEYPVDVTLYNTRMTKLTSLVNILQQTDILVIDVSDILLNMIFLRTYSVIIVIDDQCERQEAFHRAYRKLSQELTLQYVVVTNQNVSLLVHGYDSFIRPYLSFISNKYAVDCNVYSIPISLSRGIS